MRSIRHILPTLALVIGAAAPAGAQIANGGFETGALSPWFTDRTQYCGGVCVPWAVTRANAHTGVYSAEATGNIEIRQDFAPIAVGSVSSFTFWLRHPEANALPAYVSLFYSDATQSNTMVTTATMAWEQFDVTSLLSAGKQVSGFSVFGVDYSYVTRLDDVVLTPTVTTPEPTTLVLFGAGLLGVGIAGRRTVKQ